MVSLSVRILILNAGIAVLIYLAQYLIDSPIDAIHILGTSLGFYIITILSIWIVNKGLSRSNRFPVIGIVFMTTLIRIIFSIIWLMKLKLSYGQVGKANLLHFLIIYVFYLIIDAYFLDKEVRK